MSKFSAGDRTRLAQEASGLEAQLGKHEAYLRNRTSRGLAWAPVGAAGEWPGGGEDSEVLREARSRGGAGQMWGLEAAVTGGGRGDGWVRSPATLPRELCAERMQWGEFFHMC